jgi:LacI family transcriptional regulator
VTTLKVVAARAQVSLATAARVLRDDPTLSVRPATRERVLAASRDLGYRPNRVASGLRTRRSGSIAIVLPDPQNLMWGETLRAIERAAGERDYVVVVADAHGPTLDPTQLGRYVFEGRMDGLLVAFATIADELVEQMTGRGLPMVPINSRSPIVPGSVTMDDEAGSRLAVDHLVGLGHRRIAFIAGRADTDVGRRREAGYLNAMATHGLPVDPGWVASGDFTEHGAHEAALGLLEEAPSNRPTAIYTVNLISALGVRAAARELGHRIPEDLSLVTMDDHPFLAHTDPALTAVAMPMDEMGALGAQLLIDVVEGRPIRHVVTATEPRLVVRASTGPPVATGGSPPENAGPT